VTTETTSEARITHWLEPNPHKPGPAEWRIKGTGLPVWRVLGQVAVELGIDHPKAYRQISAQAISSELITAVAAYYDVAPEAIQAALAYTDRHADPVIARLVVDRAALSS
jgi:uncharacterized protein (DUF433 family)